MGNEKVFELMRYFEGLRGKDLTESERTVFAETFFAYTHDQFLLLRDTIETTCRETAGNQYAHISDLIREMGKDSKSKAAIKQRVRAGGDLESQVVDSLIARWRHTFPDGWPLHEVEFIFTRPRNVELIVVPNLLSKDKEIEWLIRSHDPNEFLPPGYRKGTSIRWGSLRRSCNNSDSFYFWTDVANNREIPVVSVVLPEDPMGTHRAVNRAETLIGAGLIRGGV